MNLVKEMIDALMLLVRVGAISRVFTVLFECEYLKKTVRCIRKEQRIQCSSM